MKRNYFLFIVLLSISNYSFAQGFGCDPGSSMENAALEKKVSSFEYDCMQYAINVSQNSNRNRYQGMTNADGSSASVPVLQILPAQNGTSNNVWNVVLTERHVWDAPVNGSQKIYQRPGILAYEPQKIVFNVFTVEMDTLITTLDANQIFETTKKNVSKTRMNSKRYFNDLKIDVEKYSEAGKSYFKLTGTIEVPEEGYKPSAVGDMISFFYIDFAINFMYYCKEEENNVKTALQKTSLPYWNSSQFGSALNIANWYSNQRKGVTEGGFNFVVGGTKAIQIDNYGSYCTIYMRVDKTTKENITEVTQKLNEWVAKNKPKNTESAEVKVMGDMPWVVVKYSNENKTGKELFSDIKDELIYEWADSFLKQLDKLTK